MKTTVNISDAVMLDLKIESARTGKTLSDLIEGALRASLSRRDFRADLTALPAFHCGSLLVNVSNRETLYEIMDGR